MKKQEEELKNETLVMRIEEGLKKEIKEMVKIIKENTGYRINISIFVESAIIEKIKRERINLK